MYGWVKGVSQSDIDELNINLQISKKFQIDTLCIFWN